MPAPDPMPDDDTLLSPQQEMRRQAEREAQEQQIDQSTLVAAEVGEAALESIASNQVDTGLLIAKTDPLILAGAFAIVDEVLPVDDSATIQQNDPGRNVDTTADSLRMAPPDMVVDSRL